MSEWFKTTLGDLVTFAGGYAFPDRYQGQSDGTWPFIKCSDMNAPGNERAMMTAANWVDADALKSMKAKVWPVGTVIFPKVGAALLTEKRRILGRAAAFDNNVMGLLAGERIMSEYLMLFMETVRLGDVVQQGAVPSVNQSHVKALPLNLPPMKEQRRIVSVVAAVDDAVAAIAVEHAVLARTYAALADSILWVESDGTEAARRSLGSLMSLDVERVHIEHDQTHRLAGVLNAGGGLIDKGCVRGADTEYTSMNVLRSGRAVMRKLTAWEGPITVVDARFDGYVASNEFPTFALHAVTPDYFRHVCRSPRLWAEMKQRVTGTVQRRKRLNPDQLLAVELPIPREAGQARSATALDATESQVNALRAELDRLCTVRARLVEALLSQEVPVDMTVDQFIKNTDEAVA